MERPRGPRSRTEVEIAVAQQDGGSDRVAAVAPGADEAALVRRSQGGDQQAFAVLVQAYQGTAYALALRLLRNPDEANDMAQEAFIRAWQALPRFRGQSRFGTWLYRIVYNLSLNRQDALRRQGPRVADGEAVAAALPAREGDPVRTAEAGELREWLWQQVDLLPERYRAVLVLYYLRELSYDEIAEILELPLGTVKTHLFRAKAELKQRLEHQWPGRPAVDVPTGPEDEPPTRAQVRLDRPTMLDGSTMRCAWVP